MNPDQPTNDTYDHPVAYDAQGQPLYAHPPTSAPTEPVRVAAEPTQPAINLDVKLKHDKSAQLYPGLNLSADEYVILAVRRHPIGLVLPLSAGVLLVSMALSLLFNYDILVSTFGLTGAAADAAVAAVPILLFSLLVSTGTYIAYSVYNNNRFFLTNQAIVEELQFSLFSRREQTVSLANIEDASFLQRGIMQQIFNYGSIRLSTKGEDILYRFSYIANPKQHIAALNNAVEAFKSGHSDSQG